MIIPPPPRIIVGAKIKMALNLLLSTKAAKHYIMWMAMAEAYTTGIPSFTLTHKVRLKE
jgi:hypothetical protein